ncbi:MAG: hypothetical protein J3K34DRAFT_469070 [Monoraphidium minutum]|nr:MAG: hypothetical protein J3K34DRAFT_469070 [Monoraphidium minutum]
MSMYRGGAAAKSRFDQLKQQVRDIKAEHREVAAAKASDREARAAAVAELCASYEQRLDEERAASSAQGARLKEALDRSAKMRAHADRERRGLQAQARGGRCARAAWCTVEKLQAAADAAAAAAEARGAEAEAARAREAGEWEARLAAERQAREDALLHLDAARREFVRQVEEWSQGEVEAIQAVAEERVADAAAEARRAREQCEGLQQQLADCEGDAQQLRGALSAARAENEGLSEAAAQLRSELEAAAAAAGAARAEARSREGAAAAALQEAARVRDAALRAVKAQHAAELEQVHGRLQAVHGRLQAVLARKDGRLAALAAQLRAAEARQRQTEDVLERQRRALLLASVDLGAGGGGGGFLRDGVGGGGAAGGRPGTAG